MAKEVHTRITHAERRGVRTVGRRPRCDPMVPVQCTASSQKGSRTRCPARAAAVTSPTDEFNEERTETRNNVPSASEVSRPRAKHVVVVVVLVLVVVIVVRIRIVGYT